MSYDAVGNLTSDNSHAYTFDAENKISKVDAVSAYTYDGEGQRVRKLVNENLRFIYDMGGNEVAEFDGVTGNLKKEYIYCASGLVATIEPTAVNANGTRYTTSDHLGSPRVLTNSAAAVISRHDYKPFGEEIGLIGGRTTAMGYSVADGVRQKFTSKERDIENGLDFFGARYFASTQGRFTGVDPYDINLERQENVNREEAEDLFRNYIRQPQDWNRYAYALNNPLKYVDPDGLKSYDVTVLGQKVTVHIDDEILKKDPGALKRIQDNLQKAFDKINAGAKGLSPEQIQSIHSQNQISVSTSGVKGTFGDNFIITQQIAENPNTDVVTADIIHDSRHSEQFERGLSYSQKTVIPMEMEASQFTLGVMTSLGGTWDAAAVRKYETDAVTGHIYQKGWKDRSTPESRSKVFSKMKGSRN